MDFFALFNLGITKFKKVKTCVEAGSETRCRKVQGQSSAIPRGEGKMGTVVADIGFK